jgi:hypothetical protein
VPPAAWKPKIEKREHPFGEQGVRSSLEAVAQMSSKGAADPRIRAWSIECLERARRAGNSVKGDLARAEALLGAVRQKLWVPDPVGTEFMAGAHLTACTDKDAPCFHGGDCDDLTILLASSFLSVGLNTMIVGHAYDSRRNIQHVLAAVRVKDQWLYADPSYDFPLGKCEPFTRERLLSVPNVKVVCDETACLTNPTSFDPEKEGFVSQGYFVGVDGAPQRSREIWWLGPARKP